jgi:hypothetical protein
MNGIRISSLIKFSGLALLAACLMAGHANAQEFEGKFTLPFQARWGNATLPAGNYFFTVGSPGTPFQVHLYRGRKCVGVIMAQSFDKTYSGLAELTLEEGSVRALNLPEIGIVLQYTPHHPKHLTAPEERQLAQLVPVTAASK